MADDIIEIDDYEVKDKQIIETNDEDNQREYGDYGDYDNQGSSTGFYKSFSLDNTALMIIGMIVILLIAIFIMIFD